MEKKCSRCIEVKNESMFGRDKTRKDGLFSYCKKCAQEVKYERKGVFIKVEYVNDVEIELKNCVTCGVFKNINEYPTAKIGLRNTLDECEKCRAITLELRRKRNLERVKKNHSKNREINIQKSRKYYQENKEILLRKQKEYYEKNKENILLTNKKWKENNKERWLLYHKEYSKEYYRDPIKRMRRIEMHRKSSIKRAEKIKVYKKSKRGREVNNRSWNKRRSLEKNLLSTLTKNQWRDSQNYFGNKCAYCGRKEKMTMEHFIPISKNGDYTRSNIIPACLSCNSSK